ncbi:MAG TPA: glycosyltransferase family 2 protein [Thermoplasmata archaeon]|nr:glycosyltransferase family 2 protein [Thermoplasmata archaeon]
MNAPTVTAVITAHDRVAFLPYAVRSALDGGADQVVVVRNFTGPIEGCAGRYLDVLCPIPDTAEKQCRGLEAARCEVVSFLDDDDVWTPEKLSRVRTLFGGDPTLLYYDHAQRPIDAEGRPILASHPELAATHPERFDQWDGRDFGELVKTIWPGNSSSTSVRRAWAVDWITAAREAGWSADLFWLVAALLSGRAGVRITPEPLTLLRLHDRNMSHARGATPEEFRTRHRIASERFARANGTLARIATERVGPASPMTQYLTRAAEGFRFFAALEAGDRARSAALRALRAGAGKGDRGVRLAAGMALVSPALARRLLFRSSLRRWALG